MDSEIQKKIEDLQILEQQLQSLLIQKQTMQIELNEIENAKEEMKKSGEEVYKIISSVMIKSDKKTLGIELDEKKKILDLKVNSIEKQEKLLDGKANELRKIINAKVSSKPNR